MKTVRKRSISSLGARRLATTLLAFAVLCPSAPRSAPAEHAPMIFITLGTHGGPVAAVERAEPANAVVVGSTTYLFDVGDGVQRQMAAAKLPLENVRAIFITHHHIDHNAGLAPLIVTRWVLGLHQRLAVVGPPGAVAMTDGLVRAYRATELAPVAIGVRESPLAAGLRPVDLPSDLRDPRVVYADDNIRVLAITNDHYHFAPGSPESRFSRSYAYRIEGRGRVIVYTGDTGPSANVVRLAAGADLLVSEVIDAPRMLASMTDPLAPPDPRLAGLITHMQRDHLAPLEVGKLAAAAGVKSLVLTHLVPGDDGEADLSGYARGIATVYHGPVHIARDLDRF